MGSNTNTLVGYQTIQRASYIDSNIQYECALLEEDPNNAIDPQPGSRSKFEHTPDHLHYKPLPPSFDSLHLVAEQQQHQSTPINQQQSNNNRSC
jgi:hypothetical protein